jgi:hypothetical protein
MPCHHNYLVNIPNPVIFLDVIHADAHGLSRPSTGQSRKGGLLEESMKKIFPVPLFCFAVSLFLTPFASAQSVSGPQMVLKEKHHDFKEVKEGAVVEHSFKVKNQGDQVLEIQRVRPG